MERLPVVFVIFLLVMMSQALLPVLGGEPLLHPNLSADARIEIEAINTETPCQLPNAVTVEMEGLLLRPYDVLTIQTEAEHLIHVYTRCTNPSRAAAFLAERVNETADASCRVFFLRGLAVTKHPIAIETLVDRLSDRDTYATLEGPGDSEDLSIGSAAAHILGRLFPNVDAGASTSWADWWGQNRDAYWRKWGETPSN